MNIPSPLHELKSTLFDEKQVKVWVKRDDLIHDEVSGNKWRKLKYNVEEYKKGNFHSILTFGGAYSNHILATAKIGADYQIPTIGIIRGEEHLPLNPTLKRSEELGMKIHYISRSEYKEKGSNQFLDKIRNRFGNVYIIPEGGGNIEGVKGCTDIVKEIDVDFDYILTDCGTGATLTGISLALIDDQKAIGIPVLKGGSFIIDEVVNYYRLLNEDLSKIKNVKLYTGFHFGGYAKHKPELLEFMRSFFKETGIKTDPVYTGKLFFGFIDLIKKDSFPKGSKIVVVHTGGLQGVSGFEERYKTKIY